MPERDVTTIKDLIFYQYAKIIARSALHAPDGTAAKANHYGFIKQTFRELHKKLFTYERMSPSPQVLKTGELKGVPKHIISAWSRLDTRRRCTQIRFS